MKLETIMVSVQNYWRADRYLHHAAPIEPAGNQPGEADRAPGEEPCADEGQQIAGTGAFGHILVAIGPNERSGAALGTAIRLAGAVNARLFLVYVYTPLRGLNPEFGYIEPDVHDDTVRDARTRLDRARSKVPESIPAETILREGDPAEEILRAAGIVHADLIVMGTRARGRVAQALMGSVATSVIHKARCPVLIVAATAGYEADVVRRGFPVNVPGLGGGQKTPPGMA
jgi:nucleotide-binding universal stress UspA family protein